MSHGSAVRLASLLVLALGVSACVAETSTFRPADASGGRRGRPTATHFDIAVGGEALGILKVWSQGISPDPDNPKELVLAIRLRIQNQSAEPITFDVEHSDVELVTEDRQFETVDAPVATTGEMTIAPGKVGRIGLRYPIPVGLTANDLGGFDFNVTLATGRGPFLETASFGRQRHDARGVYYWPMWDPWWWGYPYYPWGPGFGVGIGVEVGPRFHGGHGGGHGGRGGRAGPHHR